MVHSWHLRSVSRCIPPPPPPPHMDGHVDMWQDMVNALSRAMKLGCAEVIEFIGKLIDETGSFGLGLFAPLSQRRGVTP